MIVGVLGDVESAAEGAFRPRDDDELDLDGLGILEDDDDDEVIGAAEEDEDDPLGLGI